MNLFKIILFIMVASIPLALVNHWLEEVLHVDTRMLYSALVVGLIWFIYFKWMTKD